MQLVRIIVVNEVTPPKQLVPIEVSPVQEDKSKVTRLEQPVKALSPKVLKEVQLPNVNVVNLLHDEKQLFPIEVRPESPERSTVVSEEQPIKQDAPRDVKLGLF